MTTKQKISIAITYLTAIHILLVIVLLKSDFIQQVQVKFGIGFYQMESSELTPHYYRMLEYHKRIDGNVPAGAIIFIGDSLTQGLCVSAVAAHSVNYGIGSDTTFGVLKRLEHYSSINKAGAVVIAIGVNDFRHRTDTEIIHNYQTILDRIPDHIPVISSAVLPIDEQAHQNRGWGDISQRIKSLNSRLERLIGTKENVFFVDAGPGLTEDTGNLADIYHIGDGVHLNPAGNAIWIDSLKNELQKLRTSAVSGR